MLLGKLKWGVLTLLCVSAITQAGYPEGVDVYDKKNYKLALEEKRPLAPASNAASEIDSGAASANGQGVPPQDHAEALRRNRLAAAQGDAKAQFNLGVMYGEGEGVSQDHAEALRWYRLAAAQGHAKAQNNLGWMHYSGEGVPQDYAEALRWLRLAAAQGNAEAQNNLGEMYEYARGVPRSGIVAYALYNLSSAAASANRKKVFENQAKKVAESLSAEDIEAGQALTRALAKPGNFTQALDGITPRWIDCGCFSRQFALIPH